MDMFVLKRDNKTKECFQEHKIEHAIKKAYESINKEYNEKIFFKVINSLNNKYVNDNDDEVVIPVEDIQDIIEDILFKNDNDVALAFHDYRLTHKIIRGEKKGLAKEFSAKLMCENIENQNANIDEYSFGGRMSEAANVYKKDYALNNCVSKQTKRNHLNNEVYTHDLDSYASGEHNCLSIPFDDLLANGAIVGQTEIRPAGSINTAMQLTAVYFQIQSQEQFGGCSATHYDWSMVPYVRKSFFKHYVLNYIKDCEDFENFDVFNKSYNEIDEWIEEHKQEYLDKFGKKIEDFRLDNIENLDKNLSKKALLDTKIELYQAVEALYHNLNTLQSRPGSQLPFTSINYGTCTLPEGQMVIDAILEGSLNGTGRHHLTPIFPCGIFQCMKGVNRKPGDPNYELFRKALKSTSKRIYPNYANVDWSGNEGYDVNNPKTYFSTMGCVDGKEIITYKINEQLFVESFERMWERISNLFIPQEQIYGIKEHLFIDVINVSIFDTIKNDFVNIKRIIRNFSDNWVNVKMSNGRSLICTADHPFHIINRGRIYAKDLEKDDEVIINTKQYVEEYDNTITPEKAWLLGFIMCDGCYDHQFMSTIAISGEDDIKEKYIKCIKNVYNHEVVVKERHRGVKGNYKELKVYDSSEIQKEFINLFGGLQKIYRQIPNIIFRSKKEVRYAFLAGVIDADGYINPTTNGGSIVQIGSTNKEMALQQMALAQSLGMITQVHQNHYKGKIKEPNKIRYMVSFIPNDELIENIVCQKKKNKLIHRKVEKKYSSISKINSVENLNYCGYSYDVETESDHFEISAIYSHNCRTANGYDINAEEGQNPQLKDGRGNICPVTIILPTLAMETLSDEELEDLRNGIISGDKEKKIDKFMRILSRKITQAKDSLIERFEYIAKQSHKSAPFMWTNNTMFGYKPEEGIVSALKHGTLAMGSLGLAETLQILIGKNHTTEEGMELAKRIYRLFKKKCAEYKEEYKLNFGVYFTPAENLCYTAMKKFKNKYGIINNVSDRPYFTNSIHIPVWEEMTPFQKIDLESQLTGFSSAGCITYVETDSKACNNIDALEELVNYAMDKDIPYFAINFPIDNCKSCGYSGEFEGDVCPKCGSDNIEHLGRVTGYLSSDVRRFNYGKQNEFKDRVDHEEHIMI